MVRAVAAMAALVLALGLPRLLVLCTNDHGTHVEFAHAPGACCEHDHGDAPSPADGGPSLAEHPHCEHTGFAFAVLPAPPPDSHKAPAAMAWLGTIEVPSFALPAHAEVRTRPPATGPPRPDGRCALRATTLLLL
jgi:hypothetical protein